MKLSEVAEYDKLVTKLVLQLGDHAKRLASWVIEVQYSTQAFSSQQELESFVDTSEWQVVSYELLHIQVLHMKYN
jgi:hypothetical protein